MACSLPLHEIKFININGGFITEDGDNQRQSDGYLSGGHRHDKKDKHLPIYGLVVIGEPDQGQIHGVEHHFNTHKDDDGVAPDQDPDNSDGKQGAAESYVV